MKMSLTIAGAQELERNLATLGQRVHKKVVRKAVREGQRPLLAATKANARSLVGGEMGATIAKHLQIRAPKRQRRRGSYSLLVQLRPGIDAFVHISQSGKRSYIPAAIEYGHMSGESYVPPIPFAREAAEATRNESMRRFTEEMRIGTLREAIKGRTT